MKKILLYFCAIIAIAITSCKTTEENYRAAYELAKDKRTETGDSLVTSQLRSSTVPRLKVIGADTLPVRMIYVSSYRDNQSDVPQGTLKKYLIVVGQFKQIFNAGSMAKRLVDSGYKNAFVVYDRQKDYYVVAEAVDSSSEASNKLRVIEEDKSVVIRSPYPYVLCPAQLAR